MASSKNKEQQKQILYRDARFTNKYDGIWQNVNKCVFCDLNEKYVFFEENGIVMTISLYAYIDGHFMIVPRRHIRSVKELSEAEWQTMRKFMYIAKKLIRQVHGIKGMQIVQKDGTAAQSTVEHLHFHCVPFDAPDLAVWNYRKLKNTPLENVAAYKKAKTKIIKASQKFSEKYEHSNALPVVCDLLMVNTNNEVLLQSRKREVRLDPDVLTLPGGRVEDFTKTLEEELAREVKEELQFEFDLNAIDLLNSSISTISYARHTDQLSADYSETASFIWNVYVLEGVDPKQTFIPGDDCASVLWVPLNEMSSRKDITDGMKAVVEKYNAKS